MQPEREFWPLKVSADVGDARRAVHAAARAAGFRGADAVRLATAASELARNTVIHGKGGRMTLERIDGGTAIRLEFRDEGPGIPDVEIALRDGYSSSGSMGYGLGGARRLVHSFHIESGPAGGTRVTVVRWRR